MDSLLSGIMEKLLLTSTGKVMRTAAGKILRFSQPDFTPIKYGLLYNWYAVTDARGIAPVGFRVASQSDYDALFAYLGGISVASNKIREAGTTYWSINTGATNESGFNARGAGFRGGDNGTFQNVNAQSFYHTSTNYYLYQLVGGQSTVGKFNDILIKDYGYSIRLIADSGTPTSMTGNDGKIYPVVLIGTQRWISMNLAETKYRDGSTIPNVTDNATWASLTTGACCAYNNDQNNV